MARLYRDNVFKLHGIPQKIVSDQGKQFESNFMRLLYSLLGIKPNYSTAWHPQTNGQAERLNQHVEQYLRLYVDYHQENWVEWLAIAEFTYNDRKNAGTGKTPFINHGIHPYKGIEAPRKPNSRNKDANAFASKMAEIHAECKAALDRSSELIKRYYDCYRDTPPQYQPGDKVWLIGTNIKTNRPNKKLSDRQLGLLIVISKKGSSAYELEIPQQWKSKGIHPIFNKVLLRLYQEPSFPNQQQNMRQLPEAEDEYKIDDITAYG
ncbi:hypothetical protein AX16_002449, partial [Volvariella volvacea WC 439]